MKRRSFIKGLLGIVTLPIAVKVAADIPQRVGFSQTEPYPMRGDTITASFQDSDGGEMEVNWVNMSYEENGKLTQHCVKEGSLENG